MSKNSSLDTLARLVQVVGRDPELRRWFAELQQKPEGARAKEIYVMAERMRAEGKDEELTAVFRLLADARVFKAAAVALEESGYSAS